MIRRARLLIALGVRTTNISPRTVAALPREGTNSRGASPYPSSSPRVSETAELGSLVDDDRRQTASAGKRENCHLAWGA